MEHHHHIVKGRKLVFTIFLNLVITAAQIAGGLLSGSMALLSDALHNLSDVVTLIISLIAVRLSARKYSLQQTFGYKRAEIIAAFLNSVTMIAVSILLIVESVDRISSPHPIETVWVMILAGISIIINGSSALLLKSEAAGNMNMRSSYLHLLADMMTSVAVLGGGLIMYLTGLYIVDIILSMAISVYLIYMAWALLTQSLKVLMLFTPSTIVIEDIASAVCNLPGVNNLHHVHVWQLTDEEIHFEAHVDLSGELNLGETTLILDQVRALLYRDFQISHVTLQPECGSCTDTRLINHSK